jgi:epoxyqueuosine reductase
MSRLEEQIRTAAYRVGFQLCGFAPIQAPRHAEFVKQWVADGNAAEMTYIERGLAKRLDPQLILPEARTIITLGRRYLPPPLPAIDWQQQLRGRIAAYALSADYHVTLAAQLGALATWLTGLRDGVVARPYVDTGPILEREWAAGGGMGWFGKNTNILHTEHGSWLFLAEILTNLALESDAPRADRCGTCTRCLDCCPTQALRPGYVLDARLCISYLTIEHRGPIPVPLRVKIGDWVFGCDICQEVCPWNEQFARRHGITRSDELLPSLPDLLGLDEDHFRRRFRSSAIQRAKRDGFVRNVAVALGNTRNPAAVEPLARAVRQDPSPLVRSHAAWALGAIGTSAARFVLETAWSAEPDPSVRAEIRDALND